MPLAETPRAGYRRKTPRWADPRPSALKLRASTVPTSAVKSTWIDKRAAMNESQMACEAFARDLMLGRWFECMCYEVDGLTASTAARIRAKSRPGLDQSGEGRKPTSVVGGQRFHKSTSVISQMPCLC